MIPKCYETVKMLLHYQILSEFDNGRTLYYYDCNEMLQFSYKKSNDTYFDSNNNKMYKNQFKRFIRDYAARIKELEAFW